jgi:hypothetical protein
LQGFKRISPIHEKTLKAFELRDIYYQETLKNLPQLPSVLKQQETLKDIIKVHSFSPTDKVGISEIGILVSEFSESIKLPLKKVSIVELDPFRTALLKQEFFRQGFDTKVTTPDTIAQNIKEWKPDSIVAIKPPQDLNKPVLAPMKDVKNLLTNLQFFWDVVSNLGERWKEDVFFVWKDASLVGKDVSLIGKDISLIYNISNRVINSAEAIQRDLNLNREGKFTVLTAYTLEELLKTPLALMSYAKIFSESPLLKKISPYISPAVNITVGVSKGIGRGYLDIESTTNIIDGFAGGIWRATGYLLGESLGGMYWWICI